MKIKRGKQKVITSVNRSKKQGSNKERVKRQTGGQQETGWGEHH